MMKQVAGFITITQYLLKIKGGGEVDDSELTHNFRETSD